MRTLIFVSVSAAILGGCLTTQENPNYEFSSRYEGDTTATHQYANAPTAETTAAAFETPAQIAATTAPTDSTYGTRVVSGTPGFMAIQAGQQGSSNLAPDLPNAQIVTTAAMGAAGTPVDYDTSRNFIVVNSETTGYQIADEVRILPNVQTAVTGQPYVVQPGDTVYSLSRQTCVGVNVIQSMNSLDATYGIKIGQTLRLPAPIC